MRAEAAILLETDSGCDGCIERLTPIQAAGLPLALAGKDLIAQAKTGCGKIAAFALPLLDT